MQDPFYLFLEHLNVVVDSVGLDNTQVWSIAHTVSGKGETAVSQSWPLAPRSPGMANMLGIQCPYMTGSCPGLTREAKESLLAKAALY